MSTVPLLSACLGLPDSDHSSIEAGRRAEAKCVVPNKMVTPQEVREKVHHVPSSKPGEISYRARDCVARQVLRYERVRLSWPNLGSKPGLAWDDTLEFQLVSAEPAVSLCPHFIPRFWPPSGRTRKPGHGTNTRFDAGTSKGKPHFIEP